MRSVLKWGLIGALVLMLAGGCSPALLLAVASSSLGSALSGGPQIEVPPLPASDPDVYAAACPLVRAWQQSDGVERREHAGTVRRLARTAQVRDPAAAAFVRVLPVAVRPAKPGHVSAYSFVLRECDAHRR